jgi:SLT domain-containing protein
VDVLALYAFAARVDELAATLRARATQIGIQAATTRWHSPASRVFFARLDNVTAALSTCSARMGEVADLARLQARVHG